MGFEPTIPGGITVFKTVAFVHSAIPPQCAPRSRTCPDGLPFPLPVKGQASGSRAGDPGVSILALPSKFRLVLQPQILAKVFQAALVVAAAGPGLMAPSPPGPGQHRFVQRHGPPDQPVQQAAHLGNRQWYQGFIPLRSSPFFPLKQALAFCRTTAR